MTDIALPTTNLPVASLINELTKQPPEVPSIACVHPTENAADKLSALAWRIAERNRASEEDDPSIVRHIHDLVFLSKYALADSEFKRLVIITVNNDDKRSTIISGLSIKEKLSNMLKLLKDRLYEEEYQRFVMGMSYAENNTTPSFSIAIECLEKLVEFVLE